MILRGIIASTNIQMRDGVYSVSGMLSSGYRVFLKIGAISFLGGGQVVDSVYLHKWDFDKTIVESY